MTVEEHKRIHKRLHKALDSLVADFITETNAQCLPSSTTIMTLMEWSHGQTTEPTDKYGRTADG